MAQVILGYRHIDTSSHTSSNGIERNGLIIYLYRSVSGLDKYRAETIDFSEFTLCIVTASLIFRI